MSVVPSIAAPTPALSVRGLVKRYQRGVVAVKGVDLEVAPGEFVCLLGPSGCGKTTMLRCIAGLESVSEGEIAIAGQIVSSPRTTIAPNERNVGMVFQSYALWPHMTVGENVGYPLRFHANRRVESREAVNVRIREALEVVGIADKASAYPHELSGGQQQRVALARALVARPALVLFDEPLSNLDARLRDSIRLAIRSLSRELRFTAVYVTHDRLEAMVLADRVMLLRAGQVVQLADPQVLYKEPLTQFAAEFLGDVNVLRGVVQTVEDGLARVTVGSRIVVEGKVASKRPLQRGDPADVVIRVGNLRVLQEGDAAANSFRVRVEDAVFLGELWRLRLRIEDSEGLTLDMIAMEPPGAPGDVATVSVERARVIVLAADRERDASSAVLVKE